MTVDYKVKDWAGGDVEPKEAGEDVLFQKDELVICFKRPQWDDDYKNEIRHFWAGGVDIPETMCEVIYDERRNEQDHLSQDRL